MFRPLSLAHLTIAEVPPQDVPSIAAAAGFQSISLRLHSPRPDVASPPMLGDTPMRRATRRNLNDSGVGLFNIEALLLRPDSDINSYASLLETGAYLGAHGALVVGLDPDEDRLVDRFAALAELSASYAIALQLEFMVFSEVKSLAQAVRIVRRSGAATAGIVVDALHLHRTGSTPAEVAGLQPSLLACIQLCDGPDTVDPATVLDEARCNRGFLGEGMFPLVHLLEATPENAEIALEIPAERLRLQGVSALRRAERAYRSFQSLFG